MTRFLVVVEILVLVFVVTDFVVRVVSLVNSVNVVSIVYDPRWWRWDWKNLFVVVGEIRPSLSDVPRVPEDGCNCAIWCYRVRRGVYW